MRDSHSVDALASAIKQYFEEKDFRRYVGLFHTRTRWQLFGMREDHKQRLRQKYTVTPFTIQPYSQPDWGIFDTFRFEPEPTHSIQLSLKCPESKGAEELYYACAPAEGAYKICDYVKRQPCETSVEFPQQIDLSPLFEEFCQVISDGIQAVGKQLGGRPLGFLRLNYSVDPYPCRVCLYPYLETLDPTKWREMDFVGGEYHHSNLLGKNFRAVIEGTPRLRTLDGRIIDLAQNEFDQQFPDWNGEHYFKEAIKTCMASAVTKCLAEALRQQVFSWKGDKDVVLASHEELENDAATIRQNSVIEGIVLYGIAVDPVGTVLLGDTLTNSDL